jgi:ABC-type branched-subunit amino acid transport system substrate-binding protein
MNLGFRGPPPSIRLRPEKQQRVIIRTSSLGLDPGSSSGDISFMKRLRGSLGILFIFLGLSFSGCDWMGPGNTPLEIVPGVTEQTLLIGSSMALGGHASYLGNQTLHGALSFINKINAEGGIHGRKIKLIAYDDGYDPQVCVANTQRLIIHDKVFALFCYVGTPTTVKILPILEQAKIPLVGVFSGANALREPLNRYILNIRASYYQETKNAVKHLVEDLALKKVAVFYQYDAYGFDGLKGTELALKAFGLTPVARGTYIRGTLNVEDGLSKIKNSGAEAVVMIGTYEPCAKFVRQAKSQGYQPIFYNVSFVGADELARRLGDEGDGVIVSQVVPSPEPPPNQALLQGVEEYAELHKKFFPEDHPNVIGLEGYINARVLVEGLIRAGKDLDREKFIDALETIRNFSVGIDQEINFSPQDHQGLKAVYFSRIHRLRFVPLSDWKEIGRGRDGRP